MNLHMLTNFLMRTSLALVLDVLFPVRSHSAGTGNGNGKGSMMDGAMMEHAYGWMEARVRIRTVAGVLVVVLLAVMISKLFKK